MSNPDMLVGGYTYSYQTIARLAIKANTQKQSLRIKLRLASNGGVLDTYMADGRVIFDGVNTVLDCISKVKSMKPTAIGSARNRAIFDRDRKEALETMFDVYTWLQSRVRRGILSDGGGLPYEGGADSVSEISDDELVRNVQGGGDYNIRSASGFGGASEDSLDPQTSSWSTGGKSGLRGTYFNSKLAKPSPVKKVDPSTVEYTARPADRLEDRLFSRVDQLVGGRMASTLGRWSASPTDDSPNPVRDRCLQRGGTYIQKGKAFPIGGFSNGFAWTTNTGWNEASGINGIMGGRALLYYAHINPIKFGHAGSCKTKPSFVGDPAAIKPPMGTPGVNCCTIGMPKPTQD